MTNKSALSEVLFLMYDIPEDLQIALEAFLRKSFCDINLQKFVDNPVVMFKLLDEVVYDDLGGFSYTYDWTTEVEGWFEPKTHVFINKYDGRESEYLKYLKDNSYVKHEELK